MTQLIEKYENISTRVNRMTNFVVKRDLTKFLNNIESHFDEISKESVVCRQLNRHTSRFVNLHKDVEELIYRVEKYITIASLID